jgi:hypothetical protein
MRKLIIYGTLLLGMAHAAHAQSTSDQITLGYLSTVGCPGGQLSCWLPYTATNPMPVVSK